MKKYTTNFILALGVVIMSLLFLQQCSRSQNLKEQIAVEQQNQKALNDSVRYVKNSLGEEIALKNVLISDKNGLQDLNASLSTEVSKLKGKILTIQSASGGSKNNGPIHTTTTVKEYPTGLKEIEWRYDSSFDANNYRKIKGTTKFEIDTTNLSVIDKGTIIDSDEIHLNIVTGITELEGSYQIYLKSDYPNMKFDKIDGAILDKKRFIKNQSPNAILGPTIGIGWAFTPSQTIKPTVFLGIGVTFNSKKFIKSLFKKP